MPPISTINIIWLSFSNTKKNKSNLKVALILSYSICYCCFIIFTGADNKYALTKNRTDRFSLS